MTLLPAQPKPLEPAPVCSVTPPLAATEDPEQRMLEKRAKVVEELLQTETDYIKDLQMCVKEIIHPLQRKQVTPVVGRTGEDKGVYLDMYWKMFEVLLVAVT